MSGSMQVLHLQHEKLPKRAQTHLERLVDIHVPATRWKAIQGGSRAFNTCIWERDMHGCSYEHKTSENALHWQQVRGQYD